MHTMDVPSWAANPKLPFLTAGKSTFRFWTIPSTIENPGTEEFWEFDEESTQESVLTLVQELQATYSSIFSDFANIYSYP